MPNMSYCRFHNTNIDLRDCLDTLRENDEVLSESEFYACKEMFREFIGFCCDEGIIEDDGDLDDRLEEFFEKIRKETK